MAYIITVTEHEGGNVSVQVIDTSAAQSGKGNQPYSVYERHQFSDMKVAFKYGHWALQMFLTQKAVNVE